jgi:hypothetical protein
MNSFKKSVNVILVLIFSVMLCSSLEGCKKKKSYSELLNECIAIKDSMRKKANDAYVRKVANEILKRNFSQIDTIIVKEKRVSIGGDVSSKTETTPLYNVDINAEGKVIGTINGVKDEYVFDLHTNIIREFMESAFSSDYYLTVKDKNGLYAASVSRGKKLDIEKDNERLKANAKNDVTIDGIKVRYLSKDDSDGFTVLNYYSDKKLSDKQIRKVGKTIKLKYFYVMFSAKDDSNYAYYLIDDDVIKHRNPDNRHLYY